MRIAFLLIFVACKSEAPKAKVISGKIDVKADLKSAVAPNDTIFVIARKAAGGPPLAVKKLAAGDFPMAFELTDKDVMMGGPFEGDVEITVRVDKDGDAMTRNPGDLIGKLPKVTIGDAPVVVLLDQTLP